MVITYRLKGLDGEATEPIIESLPDEEGLDRDPEQVYKITTEVADCGGLAVPLPLLHSSSHAALCHGLQYS
jgi:E3 ubiquitin-protein ligase UBR4